MEIIFIFVPMGYKHNIEDILVIGREILRTEGYHGVGVNQILKAADIPKGSFYNFFDSKEDFAQQVVAHYGKNNNLWIEGFFKEAHGNPLEQLQSFYQLLIHYNQQEDFAGGCLLNTVGNEIGRHNDVLAQEINQQFIGWLNVLAKVVASGQETGFITKEFTPLEIAEYLHAGFYGTLSRMKVTRSRVYMDIWFQMTFRFIQA